MADKISIQRKPMSWQAMARQALEAEARAKTPMVWEVPVDQLYAPTSDMPLKEGIASGGAEVSDISPIDLIPWMEIASMGAKGAKAAISAAPKIVGNEIGAVGPGVDELVRFEQLLKPRLTDPSRVEAAKEALADIVETSGFSKYGEGLKRFKDSQKNWPLYDRAELYNFIDNATPQEIEKLLEEEYLGGVSEFLTKYRKDVAEKLANTPQGPGMFYAGGEYIPARELQMPNILESAKAAKKMHPGLKSNMGTSIGQGESVREGNITDAIEAAIRAIRYERSLPKPKLPK
jgi:hypothetical protein